MAEYIQGIHHGFRSLWHLQRAEHTPSGCWRLHVWTLRGNPSGQARTAEPHDADLALMAAAATAQPYRTVEPLGVSVRGLPNEILDALDTARSCRDIEESLAGLPAVADVRVAEYRRDAVGEVTWLKGTVDNYPFTYRVDVQGVPTVHASLAGVTMEIRAAYPLGSRRRGRHALLRSSLEQLLDRGEARPIPNARGE